MSITPIIVIVVVSIILMFLIFYESIAEKRLSDEDIEYVRSKHVINNKQAYCKLDIQKAQQYIDDYLENREQTYFYVQNKITLKIYGLFQNEKDAEIYKGNNNKLVIIPIKLR